MNGLPRLSSPLPPTVPLFSGLVFLLALLGPLFAKAEEAGEEPSPYSWKAAAASAVITPSEPGWMAGYAARKGPAEGTLQDLKAKCLALEDAEGGRFVILTFDLIGIPKAFRTAVEEYVVGKHGLAASDLLLNASHTHCGPMIRVYRPPGGGPPQPSYSNIPEEQAEHRVRQTLEYRARLLDATTQLIDETLSSLAPATLEWSRARSGFAMNRRTPAGPGKWRNSPNPDGPVDHEVPVLRVKSRTVRGSGKNGESDGKGENGEEKLIAVLFGYACHATTLSVMQYNGDWPGYAQQFFEEDHPGTTALFLNGASGDQNPYPRRLLPYVERHGRAMATAVEAALETPATEVRGPLRSAIAWPEIRYQEAPSAEELRKKAESEDKYDARHGRILLAELEATGQLAKSYPVPVQVLRFGDSLSLAAIGGEVVVDYALRLKRELGEKSGGAPVWFAGYSNDVMTYIPSRRVLEEGGYEGARSMRSVRSVAHPAPWRPEIEERLVGKVHELFDGLAP